MPKLVDANGIDSIGDKHKDTMEDEVDDNEGEDDSDSDEDNYNDESGKNLNVNDNLMNDTQDNTTIQLKWLITPTTFTSEEEIKN